ncbi:MAG: hypothetical protein NVS3B12_24860 [Acidimicrobiales bacterium]
MIELARALGVLAEPPGPGHPAICDSLGIPTPSRADYADLFLFQLYPYASVYLGPEGKLGGVAADRTAGFFRALGIVPPAELDHLAVLLGVYATLCERERDEHDDDRRRAWGHAREALLVEHLVSWVPAWLARVNDIGGPAYREWAQLLDELLRTETARSPRAGTMLSAHLVEAPHLPDPRHSPAAEFVDGLLAPVRCGLILTTSDLARAAEDLGAGRRVGERRFVIRALFDQDPATVLAWLSSAAAGASADWADHWYGATRPGRWWRARSLGSSEMLASLATDAAPVHDYA